MSPEQVERLVEGMTRPIFIYRMARGRLSNPNDGTERQRAAWQARIDKAHAEIEKLISELFGPDLEDNPDDPDGWP